MPTVRPLCRRSFHSASTSSPQHTITQRGQERTNILDCCPPTPPLHFLPRRPCASWLTPSSSCSSCWGRYCYPSKVSCRSSVASSLGCQFPHLIVVLIILSHHRRNVCDWRWWFVRLAAHQHPGRRLQSTLSLVPNPLSSPTTLASSSSFEFVRSRHALALLGPCGVFDLLTAPSCSSCRWGPTSCSRRWALTRPSTPSSRPASPTYDLPRSHEALFN